jgi:hypothetical protein
MPAARAHVEGPSSASRFSSSGTNSSCAASGATSTRARAGQWGTSCDGTTRDFAARAGTHGSSSRFVNMAAAQGKLTAEPPPPPISPSKALGHGTTCIRAGRWRPFAIPGGTAGMPAHPQPQPAQPQSTLRMRAMMELLTAGGGAGRSMDQVGKRMGYEPMQ